LKQLTGFDPAGARLGIVRSFRYPDRIPWLLVFLMRTLLVILVSTVLVLLPLGYSYLYKVNYRGLRTVEDGILYRSGQLEPASLDRFIREYGIKTVITFRDDRPDKPVAPAAAYEEKYCQEHGIAYARFTPKRWSSTDGAPPPVEVNVRKFIEVIRERRPHGPILIHCFAGIHRTGAYTAIYRMEFNGWSNAHAIQEMVDRGYITLDDDPDILDYLERYRPRN
jgi:tyrosine-protein phosphatase SIW14